MKLRVMVVGATGYSGGEIVCLLNRHPCVEIAGLCSGKSGKIVAFEMLHPSLRGQNGPSTIPFTTDAVLSLKPDLVFMATPAEVSAEAAPALLSGGVRIIDISGAFRIPDPVKFEKWYGFMHPCPALAADAVYGITELCGDELKNAKLVANPGCYPTSVIIALKPVLHLVNMQTGIICDSASGVSGAGKQSSEAYSFCELNGNFKAYNVGKHKHEPEMRRALAIDDDMRFVFVAHLLPVNRGILTTIHADFSKKVSAEEIFSCYLKAYERKPLLSVMSPGRLPELKDVVNTPRASIGFELVRDGHGIVIVSAIDNLLKGAASQAVQNMNVMFGLNECEGLK